MAYAQPVNMTSMTEVFNYADQVSGGAFYVMIPISLFIIIWVYLVLRGYDWGDCMFSASVITSLATGFLFFMGGLNGYILFTTVAVTIISGIIMSLRKP